MTILAIASAQAIAHPFPLEIEYADPRDIPLICAARGSRTKTDMVIAGCQFWIGRTARIVIPFGAKYSCIYWHELRHAYEGAWHGARPSVIPDGCDWRPPS